MLHLFVRCYYVKSLAQNKTIKNNIVFPRCDVLLGIVIVLPKKAADGTYLTPTKTTLRCLVFTVISI